MTPPCELTDPGTQMSPEERLDRVARILAEGFLRHKLRHLRKMSDRDRREISLELPHDPRTHVLEPETGED